MEDESQRLDLAARKALAEGKRLRTEQATAAKERNRLRAEIEKLKETSAPSNKRARLGAHNEDALATMAPGMGRTEACEYTAEIELRQERERSEGLSAWLHRLLGEMQQRLPVYKDVRRG